MKKEELLTTCFGLGKLPIAPGTWGSLPPVVLYQVLGYLYPAANVPTMVFLLIAFSWICIRYAPAVIEATGKKDPGMVVADEVAGQAVTMIFIAAAAMFQSVDICMTGVLGFVLFRLFDIFKPWPCKKLEKLPHGVGILADDLMAGLYGGIIAVIFILLKGHFAEADVADAAVQMNPLFAAILGSAQGLTEFLPVSSSGHLVLFEHFMPLPNPESDEMRLFDLLVHVATIGSILIVFHAQILAFLKGLLGVGKYGTLNPAILYRKSPPIRFCILMLVATVTTFVCYVLFKDPLESARKLQVLSITWLITAAVLLITDTRKEARRGLRDVGIFFAIVVGVAQSVAILPGISRSGATICTAILLGLHRRWAVEFSFLISIPAILGGVVLEILDQPDILTSGSLSIGFIAAGIITALIAGVVSLKWLVRASRKRKLKSFALYCLLLACFVLFLSLVTSCIL